MHGGPEGKTEANGGEALRIKAILVTKAKLTSSPKAPFTVEAGPKTVISKAYVFFSPLWFSHWVFRNEVFSEAYGRRVLRAFLTVEYVGRSEPIHMYSTTPLCCASQTEVAEGLLLGSGPTHVRVGGSLYELEGLLANIVSVRGSEENNIQGPGEN
jgi:hypothetical protein